ncbi:MAG: hypothetical protein QXQ46_11490, partial [Thermoplasmatales archaeon]
GIRPSIPLLFHLSSNKHTDLFDMLSYDAASGVLFPLQSILMKINIGTILAFVLSLLIISKVHFK